MSAVATARFDRRVTKMKAFEAIVELIQTGLWVLLIAAIAVYFRRPIFGLLVALQARIESGGAVKFGALELSDLRTQDPEMQKRKADAETHETDTSLMTSARLRPSHIAEYLQVEDLALRAIQAEYEVPIVRQMTAGADLAFDGAFAIGGRLHVVEVKFLRKGGDISRIRPALGNLVGAIQKYGWRNVVVILVVVFESDEEVGESETVLHSIARDLNVPTTVRVYSLPDLQRRFGLEDSQTS